MATATFDGPNKQIIIGYDGPITNITAAEMYSAWKEWVIAGNAQYQPAFGESVGGNQLGGGVGLSGYYFVRNDLGWKLLHSPYNYEIRVAGDIYPFDPDQTWIDTTPDPHSVTFVFQRSAASMVVIGTGADAAGVAAAVWDESLADHKVAGTAGKRLNDVKPTLWGV
jgi:hypothetical protein